MSTESFTPGPWLVKKATRTLTGRPYFVARDVSPRPSFSHFEQLRDENGLRTFETAEEARAAIPAPQ
ncbi:hypothetical protein [Variovorax sp. V15]|uniref:hypothetical protein n=1 Tax=Variovorax sp. V15 TaxID=3065952 RepID=UPI0034E8F61F